MSSDNPTAGEAGHTADFAVRKTRYGRDAFEVIRVTKTTAKTHSVSSRDWRGEWGRETRVIGVADYPVMGLSEEAAAAVAAAGNAEWALRQRAVDDAAERLASLREEQRQSALTAITRATEPQS